jgi:hypothetical protein
MVSIREKVFLVCGGDFLQRQRALDSIKKRLLKNEPRPLASLTFYSKEINIKDLQEKLATASFDKKRILIFKDFSNLASRARSFLFDNFKKIVLSNYIIFETDSEYYYLQRSKKITADKLFAIVISKSAVYRVASPKRSASMQDFMDSVRRNDLASCLYILECLFEGGAKEDALGPQIIGILTRKFSYHKNSSEKETYFKYLWEADRAIKEKGLGVRLIIEALLVKLIGPH